MANLNLKENYKCDQVKQLLNHKYNHLLIMGKSGTGKTHAMKYIQENFQDPEFDRLAYQTNKENFMLTSYDFVNDMYLNISSWKGNPNVFDRYQWVRLLLIDDLGIEPNEDKFYPFIYKLLDMRERPLVISTNLTMEELYSRYGERIVSRIIGKFKVVNFSGDDWRKRYKSVEEAKL